MPEANKDGLEAVASQVRGRMIDPSDDLLPPSRPRSLLVRVGLMTVGVVLIAAGVALGPVPVVPGFPLVILGVLLVTMSSAAARKRVNALEKRLPRKMRDTIKRVLRDNHLRSANTDATSTVTTDHTQREHTQDSPMDQHTTDALHPEDRAFLEQRYRSAPLIFGVVSLLTAPIVLGMLPGALGLRAGIDLWRRGLRNPLIGLGVAASSLGIVASIVVAVVWGSLLAGVLLGRDAMRETERWRGLRVEPFSCVGEGATGSLEITVPTPAEDIERTVLLFVAVDSEPSKEALATLASILGEYPSARLLVIDPSQSAASVATFVGAFDIDAACIGRDAMLPNPLDRVAAFPTLVVMRRDGRVEFALVGARTSDELRSVISGEAAKKADEHESARRDTRAALENRGGGG